MKDLDLGQGILANSLHTEALHPRPQALDTSLFGHSFENPTTSLLENQCPNLQWRQQNRLTTQPRNTVKVRKLMKFALASGREASSPLPNPSRKSLFPRVVGPILGPPDTCGDIQRLRWARYTPHTITKL